MAKDFKSNPAMNFISADSVEKVERSETAGAEAEPKKTTPTHKGGDKPPKGYKVNPEYIEVRSKRFQLLLQPSVYNAIKKQAKKDRVSMGEVINRAVAEYLGLE